MGVEKHKQLQFDSGKLLIGELEGSVDKKGHVSTS